MKKYEYKFIEVPIAPQKPEQKEGDKLPGQGPTAPFEACKKAICGEAACGWRLKQVLPPQMSVYGAYCYQLIFEKKVE